MLKQLNFIINDYEIILYRIPIIKKIVEDFYNEKEEPVASVCVRNIKTCKEQRIDLPISAMREMIKVLNDSPFIFSEKNKQF